MLNLRTLADPAALHAKFRNLDAYVWPKGPAGVSFSAAECAELYGHLRAFYFHKDWDFKVDPAKSFVRVELEQFRSWICRTVQPADSPVRTAWAAINELLRSKLQAAGILDDYYVACWRVIFRLNDKNPDHQDVEAEYDLYAAGGKRCLLSRNDSGQQRPFIFSLGGAQLFETDSSFLAMDGAAADSGGARFSPYSHGRYQGKGKLGGSI